MGRQTLFTFENGKDDIWVSRACPILMTSPDGFWVEGQRAACECCLRIEREAIEGGTLSRIAADRRGRPDGEVLRRIYEPVQLRTDFHRAAATVRMAFALTGSSFPPDWPLELRERFDAYQASLDHFYIVLKARVRELTQVTDSADIPQDQWIAQNLSEPNEFDDEFIEHTINDLVGLADRHLLYEEF